MPEPEILEIELKKSKLEKFHDKYTSEAKQLEPGEDKKIVVSNDTYAFCELLEQFKDVVAKK